LAWSFCRASKVPFSFKEKTDFADWERFDGELQARFSFFSKAEFAEGRKLVF